MLLKQVLISIFFFTVSFTVNAQNIGVTFDLAEHQFELGNFDQAKKLYERVLFFDSLNLYYTSYARLGVISLAQENKKEAVDLFYSFRDFLEIGTNEWYNISFKIASIHLQNDIPKEALSELLQMNVMPLDSTYKKRLKLYLAVAYFQDKAFESSKSYFKLLVDSTEYTEIDMIFKKNNRLEKRYNSYRLQVFSAFLPGSGQMYAGFYKEGVNSFILVGSFVALFVKTSKVYGVLDALLSVYPWVSRYHVGGIQKVADLAKNRVKLKRNAYYHELLELI